MEIQADLIKFKIGFIGCGNMGGALMGGMLESAFQPCGITVFDANADKRAELEKTGVCVAQSSAEVEEKSDIIIFAVKPNIIDTVLSQMTGFDDKIYLSIAAGVTVSHLEEMLGADKKIVRAMPNTPAQVGCGMTVISPNKNVNDDDIKKVKMILGAVGAVEELPEKFMSIATALHGSSPAYVYMMIDAMADAGVEFGLTKAAALRLAANAVKGSAEMVLGTGLHPEQLKDNVCSPGGTTIAAVCDLENNKFRATVQSAVRACVKKAEDMSK